MAAATTEVAATSAKMAPATTAVAATAVAATTTAATRHSAGGHRCHAERYGRRDRNDCSAHKSLSWLPSSLPAAQLRCGEISCMRPWPVT
jgi:hypothetical protein